MKTGVGKVKQGEAQEEQGLGGSPEELLNEQIPSNSAFFLLLSLLASDYLYQFCFMFSF